MVDWRPISIADGLIATISPAPAPQMPVTRTDSQPMGPVMLPTKADSATPRQSSSIVRVRARYVRSEEHTSELQSLAYLVCRLLLEKKKNKNNDLYNCYTNIHQACPDSVFFTESPSYH